jgi:hypothetical protein
MSATLPDIDFHLVRPYGQPASRANGFEEVASILIEQGIADWPAGVRFERFGNPDGGREGRGVLANGDVWAWQAKYLFGFDSTAAGEVTESVRRVLGREPGLKRYYIALPIDLPAGDTEDRTSASTRWAQKVEDWEALASQRGLTVEFIFVGAHMLVTALTEPRHSGRARYWFGAEVMSPEWQRHRLDEAIGKAGRRYTPKLNVQVEATQALDAVGRADGYVKRWQHLLAELRQARRWPWRSPADVADKYAEALPTCESACNQADAALASMIAGARAADELPQIEAALGDAAEAIADISSLLRGHSMTKDGYYVGDAASLYSDVRAASGAIWRAGQLAGSAMTRAAREKLLLVSGHAGVGKTHLMCDVSAARTANGRPTVLLLGQDFDSRALLPQIGELTQLGGSYQDVLAVLDASAEAASCIGLLIIDALNESEHPDRWRADLQALRTAAARYPNIAVVISCRTEFLDDVVGSDQIAVIEHVGFAEATDLAIRRFAQEYGLEPPTFPVLNPEFGNPLFLKLTCEALQTLGATRFPFGSAGLTTVCEAFLQAVNKRLSESGRCDYDARMDLVGRAVRQVALLGRDPVRRADLERITTELLPGRTYSRSLMRGLIAESVFVELSGDRVSFGYQRLGDMARASALSEGTSDDVRAWLSGLGPRFWSERGVVGALAVIVPERFGMELIDLAAAVEGKAPYVHVEEFVESLLLRSRESVSPRSVEIVERLLDDRNVEDLWDHLVRIACVPGHPLNARWLHGRLAALEVWDRDQRWSTWLVDSLDPEGWTSVRRLIEWAWPDDLGTRGDVPDDVAELVTHVLGWFLTTNDRRVRDRATKAIVSVGERSPTAFANVLARFRGTNDPYVVERLTTAACGVVLRTGDAKVIQGVADGLAALVKDGWPAHLMTRDFVRRVFGAAKRTGWIGPDGLPPYDSEWPPQTRPIGEIEALAGPPDYAYGSIWHSLTGMGDFGRYILRSALRKVEVGDERTVRHEAERVVFDRALELGWTPERFAEIERHSPGRRDPVVERVGKKYQWIGFYEVLGRIADHHRVTGHWGDERSQPYAYAEQLVWRDIDPTVLVRKPPELSGESRPWFSPAEALFGADVPRDYPTDMIAVPDPLDSIAVLDPEGLPWLVLASNPKWEQPLDPELEALRYPSVGVGMNLDAYLVPLGEANRLRGWAKDKAWDDLWMPQSAEATNVLLGAHPDDPEWVGVETELDSWEEGRSGSLPARLSHCATWYGGTGTSRDASAEYETRGHVPSRTLFDVLGLSRGVDFSWSDPSGLAVWDPSVVTGGPSALVMRRDLLGRLAAAGFTLFWTALVQKELHRKDFGVPGDDYRWITASASYILSGEQIELVGARAVRCQPGPTMERTLDWAPRPRES